MDKRSPYLSILYSVICPGLGQIYNGQLVQGFIISFSLAFISFIYYSLDLWIYPKAAEFYKWLFYLIVIFSTVLAWVQSRNNSNYKIMWFNRIFVYLFFMLLFRSAVHLSPSEENYTAYYFRDNVMSPRYNKGETVLVTNARYKRDEVQKDSLYYVYLVTNGRHSIKRVVAIGGDTAIKRDNKVYVNNKLINSYGNEWDNSVPRWFEQDTIIIKPGHFFVLGENINSPLNFLDIKQIPYEYIRGKPLYLLED